MNSPRAIRRLLAGAAVAAALIPVAGAQAAPATSVKLRLGASAAGAENYLFTDGNQVFVDVANPSGASYRISAIEPNGTTTHAVTACTNGTAAVAGTYTVGAADPVSAAAGWTMRYESFGGSNCTGAAATPINTRFDVARASSFDSSTLTTPKALFGRNGSTFVSVAGLTPSRKDWKVRWSYGASDTTACQNTVLANGNVDAADLPNSASTGALPDVAPAYLQYPPSPTGTAWNAQTYDAPCPSINSGSDGQWRLTLTSSVDTTHFVSLAAFNVDATAPAVTVTSPVDGSSRAAGAAPLSGAAGTAAGDSGNVSVTLYDDLTGNVVSGPTTVAASAGSWSSTSASLGNGAYHVEATQTDAAGNSSTAVSSFTVDGQSPHPTITVPSDGAALNTSLPTLQGTAGTVAGLSPDNLQMTLNIYKGGVLYDSHSFNRSGGGWSTQPTTPLTDGSYTAEIVQGDAANNVGTSPQVAFSVDTAAPTVTLTQPFENTLFGSSTPAFSGTAGTSGGDGPVVVKIWNGTNTSVSPARSFSFTPDSSSWTFTVPDADALANGTYTVRAEQSDAAANTGVSDYRHFKVDSTPPSSSVSVAPVYSNGSAFAVSYTAADVGPAGLQRVELWAKTPGSGGLFVKVATDTGAAIDNSFGFTPTDGDGTYYFYTVAVDNAGHAEAAPSGSSGDALTDVDTGKPSSSANTLSSISGTTALSVGYTAVDNAGGVGLDHVDLYVKRGSGSYTLTGTDYTPVTPTFAYTAPADDSYCFYTVAVDRAGNAEAAPSASGGDTCTTVDTAKPNSSVDTLPTNTGSRSVSVPWHAADNGGGVGLDHVDLYARQGAGGTFAKVATNSSPGATGSFPYSAPADDTYCFYSVAVDKAGNAEDAPVATDGDSCTTVDIAAPVATVAVPADPGNDNKPDLFGDAGTQAADATHSADAGTVTVRLWSGTTAGTIAGANRVFTGVAVSSGHWQLQDSDYSSGLTAALGDGNWTARVYQSDAAGNAGSSAPLTFLVDTGKPASAVAALPTFTNVSTVPLTYTTSDDAGASGVDRVELWVKRGSGSYALADTDTSPATPSFSYSAPGDDSYCFYTVAIDKATNHEAAPAAAAGDACIQVDTANPSSSVDARPANSNTRALTVAWHGADDAGGSGLDHVDLYAKRGSGAFAKVATNSSPGATGSFPYSAPADDTYCFYTVAVDKATNAEAAPVGANGDGCTTVDVVAPAPTLTVPADPGNDNTPALSGNAGAQAADATHSADGGTVTVRLWSGSTAGTNAAADRVFTGVAVTAGHWQLGDSDYSSGSTAPLGDGRWTARVEQSDAAGNSGPSTPLTFLVDTGKPASAASGAPAFTNAGTISVNYSTSDDAAASGVDRVELWVKHGSGSYALADTDASPATPSFTYTVAAGDDTYCFYTVAIDKATNREAAPASASGDVCTTVETVAPHSQASAFSTAFKDTRSFAVDYTAGDDAGGSGLDQVDLYVSQDSGPFTKQATDTTPDATLTFAYTAPADGRFCFATVAVDKAGNSQAAPSGTGDTCTTVDTGPPTVQLSTDPAAPGQNSFFTHVTVHLTVSDSDPNLTIACTVDGTDTALAAVAGGGYDVPVSGDKEHTVQCSATDSANNSGSDQKTFKLDEHAPAVTLAQPANGANTHVATPALSGAAGTATNDDPHVKVEIYAGASASGTPLHTVAAAVAGAGWTATAPALGDGTYTAVAKQLDMAANEGSSAAHTFKVDTSAPAVTSSNNGQTFVQGSPASAAYSCDDESGGSGIDSCSGDLAQGAPLDTATAGAHSYHVTARDRAGNETSATVSYTVSEQHVQGDQHDLQPPQLSSGGTKRSQALRGGSLNLDLVCDEACNISAGGTIALPGAAKVHRLKTVTRNGVAGAHVKLSLRLDKATLKGVRATLKKHKPVTAKLTVTAQDASGNKRPMKISVRITMA